MSWPVKVPPQKCWGLKEHGQVAPRKSFSERFYVRKQHLPALAHKNTYVKDGHFSYETRDRFVRKHVPEAPSVYLS